MTALYREFPLRSPAIWPTLVAFIKSNAQCFADKGQPLRVIVTADEKSRNSQQNRFFHGPVLDAITQQAWIGGKQYPKEFWKEYFRRRFLLKDEYEINGEIINVYWSTADKGFSVGMMADFLNKLMAEAATDFGVIFDE